MRCWAKAAVLASLLGWAAAAPASSLEKLLMPGEVAAGHAKLEGDCTQCHDRSGKVRQTDLCVACHKDIGADLLHQRGFHGHALKPGAECTACHTEHKGRAADIVRFDRRSFDHATSGFKLDGRHTTTACEACHATGKKFREAPANCVDCHTRDDAHKGGRGPKCGDCHNTEKWKQSSFDHEKVGHFALNAAHAKIACDACHRSGDMKTKLPDKCAGCHAADDRHGGRFGDDCAACHNEQKWKEARYDHEATAHFALKGKHAKLDCSACHVGPVSGPKLPKDCAGCHRADDVHHGSMGAECASCHVETGWKDQVRFDHDMTRFPLVGLHASVACEECHASRAFRGTARDCISCHRADDVHKGNLGKDCAACHNPNGWKFWQFDHGKSTHFALEGAHAKLSCNACHVRPADEVKLSRDCASCHQRDDVHNGGFGRDCARCHGSILWRGAGVRQ